MLGTALLLVLGGLATSTQDAARERLEALIEETNALEHFHAEYTLSGEELAMRALIDYRAPDALSLRMESSGGGYHMGMADGRVWMRSISEESGPAAMDIDLRHWDGPCGEAIAVIRSCFWMHDDGPEVLLRCDWDVDPATDKTDLNLSAILDQFGGDASGLLGWLHTMKSMEGSLSLEGGELVHRTPRFEARVDSASGFLLRLALEGSDGKPAALELVELDFETAPDPERFVAPERHPDAQDLSKNFESQYVSLPHVRDGALTRVHALLEREYRRLDGEVHDDLERFFTALYDPAISARHATWLEETRTYAVGIADWIRQQLAEGRSQEEIEQITDEHRRKMEGYLETARQSWHASIPSDPQDRVDSESWRAIRALEDEVLDARFEALVARPMLDDFDTRVEAALTD